MPDDTASDQLCQKCQRPIGAARLEALPDTKMCVDCARKFPPPPIDPQKLDISQASPINSNGFAPKD